MAKKTFIQWIIFLIVALWILCLPLLCKADPLRPWTNEEMVLLFWSSAATVADIYTTTQFLRNDDNWETNPVLGKHPDPLAVITVLITSQLITIGIAHFFPDLKLPLIGKVNVRQQLLYTKASINTANTCWNTRLNWD